MNKHKYLNEDILKNELIEAGITDVDNELEALNKMVSGSIKKAKKKQQRNFEEYSSGQPFIALYPDYNNDSLPTWIKEKIDVAHVVGNAKQTLMLPDGRKYQLNNTLNHLSGGEWTYFTNSVLNTAYRTTGEDSMAHDIRKIHPTPKPPQLMKDIIEFFTKEQEIVLDYFMGVGGTLLGAGLCNRRAIGIELNNKYIEAYKEAAQKMNVKVFPTIHGDSIEILSDNHTIQELLGEDRVGLILIDPPYANMMSRKKTGADIEVYGNTNTPFTNDERDLGNLDIVQFYEKLKLTVDSAMKYLKVKGYVIVFIKDLQPHKKDINLLHAEIIQKLNTIPELEYKGLRIWADQTTKLFPYGYPFSFVANQIHQYILVFRKEKR